MDPAHDAPDARAGSDAEVVSTLVASHRRFLAFLERRLGDRALAEDILQAAFVRGIERLPPDLTEDSAVAWFFRVLRNAVVDHFRRAGTSRRPLGEAEIDLDGLATDDELRREACRCILELAGTLKPEYAAALRQVDVEGKPVQDFARDAGITPNNASVRLFRAREALEKRLKATCRTCAEHGCLDCSCGSAKRR